MSKNVEEKAVELMDRSADAVEAFAVKLQALTLEYGPEVVDAVFWVARVDALSVIGVTAGVLIAGIALALNTKRAMAWSKRVEPNSETPLAIWGHLVGLSSIVLLSIATIRILNPWPWVGVIEPQLWIAKKILGL